MLKNLHWHTTLSVILSALLAGCATADLLPTTSSSPPSEASEPLVNQANLSTKQSNSLELVTNLDNSHPATQEQIEQYINKLATQGAAKENQGVWIQTGDTLLANYQGSVPQPAASITKVATTLAALQTFGPDHQFVTLVGATGAVANGVLQGDLVIIGGEDPFFVWEEAVAVGNLLNQLGIKRVAGNLVITGKFYMNFQLDPIASGNLLKQGLNAQIWPKEAETQYRTLPIGTPQPQVEIAGSVMVSPSTPSNVQPLVRHYSFPLAELLKKMNLYSNNVMVEILDDAVGGTAAVGQKAAEAAGVPLAEIQLKGSIAERKISPRAACGMFIAIERYLQAYNLTVADVFAIIGQDPGILEKHQLPRLSVIKSGSWNNIGALVGGLPTQKQGTVWFAVMNIGEDFQESHAEQEILLKSLLNQWGAVPSLPIELKPNPERKAKTSRSEVIAGE
ncbi:MAG: D-alanyl-D-alanine carboxypeptidase [Symploca sp. SIO2E6]|nr:D-alanyl-D-alanine carboxypeptidase [Symploca sp. SIO2E6]